MDREINKQLIEKQAREILDKFACALQRIEKEQDETNFVDREEFERQENAVNENCDNKFKQKMLANAPMHDEDFIVAEKKEWK